MRPASNHALSDARERLEVALATSPTRVIACSGGIDSLVLSTIAHLAAPTTTVIAHTSTPAVPGAATARVAAHAERNGWTLRVVTSNEFDDERYLANPTERCYYCKTNLYAALTLVADELDADQIMSGANLDDLGEYRPGLDAAAERGVRHPFLEADIDKATIRALARDLGLQESELPAAPCLASRIYTGTRVTESRLRAIEVGETLITELTGLLVVRCRIQDDQVTVEVPADDRSLITDAVLTSVHTSMTAVEPSLTAVSLDPEPYASGRAFIPVTSI